MNTPRISLIQTSGHAHAADLEACLDLLNTESYSDGMTEEHLASAEDAVGWFALRGLAHEDALRRQVARDGAAAWLERVRGVRRALRQIWDAEVEHRSPGEDALGVVNAVLREAPGIELVARDDGCGVGHRHTADDPTGEALARLAQPLAEAIAVGDTDRFRICANDGCRWVFEDTSRGGRRRWCDMSSCGNRAKVRRFRSRHRGDDVSAADAGAADAPAPPA